MTQNQFGFRENHSTSHALNYSVNHIKESLKDKIYVLGIFTDFSKLLIPSTTRFFSTNYSTMESEGMLIPFLKATYPTVYNKYMH